MLKESHELTISQVFQCLLNNYTFRFDKNWLKPSYRDKRSKEYKRLKQDEKTLRVIDGVHKRHYVNGWLVDKPSKEDYNFLNRAYNRRREFDNRGHVYIIIIMVYCTCIIICTQFNCSEARN